jgi:predicted RNA-binding protein with PUA-like domain
LKARIILFHFSSAKKDNPRWFMVDVHFKRMMKRYIPLSELKELHLKHKESGGPLKNIALFTRARLSVQPLTQGKKIWLTLDILN